MDDRGQMSKSCGGRGAASQEVGRAELRVTGLGRKEGVGRTRAANRRDWVRERDDPAQSLRGEVGEVATGKGNSWRKIGGT